MRTILPHWDYFAEKEELCRKKVIEIQNRRVMKDYESALSLFVDNEKAEAELHKCTNGKPMADYVPKHFEKMTLDLLRPFVIVRATEDPCSDIAKHIRSEKKGKLDDFDANTDLSDKPCLLEWAYKIRTKDIIAKRPDPPVLLEDCHTPIPIPVLQDIPLNPDIVAPTHFDFLTPEWIDNICKYVGNCLDQQPEFAGNWKDHIQELNDGTLSDIIKSRLGTHVSEFGDQLDINDGCWYLR